tara:strand:+ start:113 stop:871 length:759 start_codon:yes stop_codon:yes gene_type:complete
VVTEFDGRWFVSDIAGIKAFTFDVGGTVLDWHSGTSAALKSWGETRGISLDWPAVANEWRRQTLGEMLGPEQSGLRAGALADLNIDGVHKALVGPAIEKFGGPRPSDNEAQTLAIAWHGNPPWPDSSPGIQRLNTKYITATLTILSVALIVDASRLAGFRWDAVISCEMLDVYKLNPKVYREGARLLGLDPAEIVMVAAHDMDLNAARAQGFRSAFVARRVEWGANTQTPTCADHHDFIVDSLEELADQVSA